MLLRCTKDIIRLANIFTKILLLTLNNKVFSIFIFIFILYFMQGFLQVHLLQFPIQELFLDFSCDFSLEYTLQTFLQSSSWTYPGLHQQHFQVYFPGFGIEIQGAHLKSIFHFPDILDAQKKKKKRIPERS